MQQSRIQQIFSALYQNIVLNVKKEKEKLWSPKFKSLSLNLMLGHFVSLKSSLGDISVILEILI